MELPQAVNIGHGILKEIGLFLKMFKPIEKILIVSGPNVSKKVNNVVCESLSRNEFSYEWYTIKSSTLSEVEEVENIARVNKTDLIIGLGGGKAVDVAKLGSFRHGSPFVSIPTSASHDGMSSPFASIHGGEKPYSYTTKPPIGVLADIDVIINAPSRLLAAGCGDLLAKFTAVRDWVLGHKEKNEYYGRYAASLALLSADLVLQESTKIGKGESEYIRNVVEALISSGVAAGIAGSSRPCSGSEHLFYHALDLLAPGIGLHGELCGLGTIMMAKLHGLEWEKIRQSLENVNAPTTANALGISEDLIIKALMMAPNLRPDRYTILNKVQLNPSDAKRLAKDTLII